MLHVDKKSSSKTTIDSQSREINSLETAALQYRELGIPIIPIRLDPDGTKHPAIRSWKRFQMELPSQEEIHQWFGSGEIEMLAIVTGKTSGLLMIGPDGEKGCKYLEEKGIPPNTPTVSTGNKNHRHFYFRFPEGLKQTNFIDLDDLGFDVRGEGGFSVAPPSKRDNLPPYEWETPLILENLSDPPKWFYTLLRNKQVSSGKAPKKKVIPSLILNGLRYGERNDKIYAYASSLRSRRIPIEEAEVLIQKAVQESEQPPDQPFREKDGLEILYRVYKTYPAGWIPDWNSRAITSAKLLAKNFSPLEWLVPELLPRGDLVILGGKPKVGKSHFALQLSVALAEGKLFLERRTRTSRVLFYVLEDSERAIQERLRKMGSVGNENLQFCFECPQIDDNAGLIQFKKDTQGFDLVVVDILNAALVKKFEENNAVDVQRILKPLLKLAHEQSLTLLLIHHHKKGPSSGPIDDVRGSSAFTGKVDYIWGLYRTRKETKANFSISGREVEETDTDLLFDGSTRSFSLFSGQPPQETKPSQSLNETQHFLVSKIKELGGRANSSQLRQAMQSNGKPISREGLIKSLNPLIGTILGREIQKVKNAPAVYYLL